MERKEITYNQRGMSTRVVDMSRLVKPLHTFRRSCLHKYRKGMKLQSAEELQIQERREEEEGWKVRVTLTTSQFHILIFASVM